MSFDEAMALVQQWKEFLTRCGGPYAEGIKPYVEEHMIIAVATGQYLWAHNQYFCCWWMLDAAGLRDVQNHIRPRDVSHGSIMCVMECGAKDKAAMGSIRRALRAVGNKEVHWHRYGKGWQHFYRQKGALYGR